MNQNNATTAAVKTVAKNKIVNTKNPPKKVADLNLTERFAVDANVGLNDTQIDLRLQQGLYNSDKAKKGKSIATIILSNIFTFFNLIYILIAIILIYYGQWANATFLAVIVANTLIAIIQETNSKRMLDKLNLITVPTVKVVRNGLPCEISVNEIVLDDIVKFASGQQISCDCRVIDGTVEVNESILTGESEAVQKNRGDVIFAGSFVVSGNCTALVEGVGKYNYISSLTGRARKYKKPPSQMLKSLKLILYFVAIIIVPMTLCLWIVNAEAAGISPSLWIVSLEKSGFDTSTIEAFLATLNNTSGSIISMIPAGPFLLTTVTLAVSVVRLGRKHTMVQELYCIEMLARVNCLCLDKTGTITDGTMKIVDSVDLRSSKQSFTIREIMGAYNHAQNDDNLTSRALKKYFGSPKSSPLTAVTVLPFSSQRKMSAVSFKEEGTYFLGAPEFVLKNTNEHVSDLVEKYASKGLRVLVLAHSNTTIFETEKLPAVRRAIAVIAIEDKIRPDAAETIKWFCEKDVDLKVISGDNALTVAKIAQRVGIPNADKYISLENMTDQEVWQSATQYSVFGRVSPDQKAILVKALKSADFTVAMTGDGVNDILAMKESDCSISLAGGSDAARNVAHLVLMDDSFAVLPEVVGEGRRVVNNIQSATSMYFMKTVYIILMNIGLILLHFLAGFTASSPYQSIQIMLLETVIVGLPTTLLALQPNHNAIEGRFLGNILRRCLPASITFILVTVGLYLMKYLSMTYMTDAELSTLVAIAYTFGGFFALFYACKPFNLLKKIMYVAVGATVVLAIGIAPSLWRYTALNREQILLLTVAVLVTPVLLYCFMFLFKLTGRNKPKKLKRRHTSKTKAN